MIILMKQVVTLIGILLLLFLYLFMFNDRGNKIEYFEDNACIACKADAGKKGEAGPKGLQGDQGIQGVQGPTGQVGPRGNIGQNWKNWFISQPSTVTWQASNNAKSTNPVYVKDGTITPEGVIRALSKNDIFRKAIQTTVDNAITSNMDTKISDYFDGTGGQNLLKDIIGNNLVPAYTIVPYYYTTTKAWDKIKDKWQICDGEDSKKIQFEGDNGDTTHILPNLVDKFIKGAELLDKNAELSDTNKYVQESVDATKLTINNNLCSKINELTYKTTGFKAKLDTATLQNVASDSHTHSLKDHTHSLNNHTHPISKKHKHTFINDKVPVHSHGITGIDEYTTKYTDNLWQGSDKVKTGGEDRHHQHYVDVPDLSQLEIDNSGDASSTTGTTGDGGSDNTDAPLVDKTGNPDWGRGGNVTGELEDNGTPSINWNWGKEANELTVNADDLTCTDITISLNNSNPEPAHFTLVFIIKKPIKD